jgi:hypothetical protein
MLRAAAVLAAGCTIVLASCSFLLVAHSKRHPNWVGSPGSARVSAPGLEWSVWWSKDARWPADRPFPADSINGGTEAVSRVRVGWPLFAFSSWQEHPPPAKDTLWISLPYISPKQLLERSVSWRPTVGFAANSLLFGLALSLVVAAGRRVLARGFPRSPGVV